MAAINTTDLTNKTSSATGTGVFDLLFEATNIVLQAEYDSGRITGPEYSTVYLGGLQSVLQQSVNFLLSQQKAAKEVDLLDKQISEADERISLVIAQTAKMYEDIDASKAKTNRENLINNKQATKVQKDTLLTEAQIAEQEYMTGTIRPEEVLKIKADTSAIGSRDAETLASTIRSDNESVKKVALIAAQTLGFASDTKQKLLKQMQDGFAVALSIAGVGNVPEANQDAAIDALAQELLTDVGSSVTIPGETVVPTL